MIYDEEEHRPCCGFNGDGAAVSLAGGEIIDEERPSKKPKQKKTPQRGLGVAQLEKIRLGEQQGSTTPFPPATMLLPPVMPRPSPSPPNFTASSSSNLALPSAAPFCNLPVPTAPPSDAFSAAPSAASFAGAYGCSSSAWTPPEMIMSRHEHLDAGKGMFGFPVPQPAESPDGNRRSLQSDRQRRQRSSHLFPVPLAAASPLSPASPAGLRLFQMEPPSNQSSTNPSNVPLWPGEDKVSPLLMDPVPDFTAFPCQLRVIPLSTADEHPPVNPHQKFRSETTNLRDGHPHPFAVQLDWRSSPQRRDVREKSEETSCSITPPDLTSGSSLPPPAAARRPPARSKQPDVSDAPHPQENYAPVPSLVRPRPRPEASPGSRLPFYVFLPTPSSSQKKSPVEERDAEQGLDLDLKL